MRFQIDTFLIKIILNHRKSRFSLLKGYWNQRCVSD